VPVTTAPEIELMAILDAEQIRRLIEPLQVRPGRKVDLPGDFDPGHTAGFVHRKDADDMLERSVELLADYQERLAAQDTFGLLVILQAIDAAGKDGTIRHVMSGVNPQGVQVTSFKAPSATELDHDYLWRAAAKLPARGMIGVFNRSYYEEVLVVRVHPEFLDGQRLPRSATGKGIWKRRYREINDWERYLVDNGFRIVKLFLNVSKSEQAKRFIDRIDEPHSNWKFSPDDLRERARWDDYQHAFSEMLSNTSTTWAPWHVIPADHKWFMRIAASAVILDALLDIDPQYPEPSEEDADAMARAKAELLGGG
jgi:PPK2 family polyphosphate:nucleotide phosphotransferase